MKRLGIDARLINQTGVGSYTHNLLLHLLLLISEDIEVFIFMRSEDMHSLSMQSKNVHIVKADYTWHSFKEQISFLALLQSYKLDLMHFTYFSFPMFYTRPFVITIHDITPLLFATGKASTRNVLLYKGKFLAYKLLMKAAVYRPKAILAPTESVKDDIIKKFPGVDQSRIHVTYEGIPESHRLGVTPKKSAHTYPSPFYLYVGNFYPHKNISSLLHAFKEVRTDAHLILAGPEDHFSHRMKDLSHKLSINHKVHFIHSLPDSELSYLFAHAKALIHPSKAEGFGLTLLEASAYKCPVIASDIPVIRETMGDNFIPFDPIDIYSIATAIQHFDDHPEKKYLPLSVINERFSFKTMARQTWNIYEKILG